MFDPPATTASKKLAASADYTEHFIARGADKLYVRDYDGEGTPIVCLHGFPDNLHIFDQLAAVLAGGGRRVVLMDFLGYGASSKPDGFNYGFAQQQDDLLSVVDGLDIEKAHLVAHDAGAVAAINFLIDRPERVERLGLLNCIYAQTPSLVLPELIELFAHRATQRIAMAATKEPKQLQWLLGVQREGFGRDLSEEGRELMNNILQPQIAENFAHGAGPAFAKMTGAAHPTLRRNLERLPELADRPHRVTMVWGRRDPYLTTDVANEMSAGFANVKLHIVDAGHWLQIEAPEETARLLLDS